jgi:UDP-glucose 4-epimerase
MHGPAKPGEQQRSCLAIATAARVIGWSPKTRLEEGLKKTIAAWGQAGG